MGWGGRGHKLIVVGLAHGAGVYPSSLIHIRFPIYNYYHIFAIYILFLFKYRTIMITICPFFVLHYCVNPGNFLDCNFLFFLNISSQICLCGASKSESNFHDLNLLWFQKVSPYLDIMQFLRSSI